MKNLIIAFLLTFIVGGVSAQIRQGSFFPQTGDGQYMNNNQLLFMNDKPFEDLRVHNAGAKAIVIMGLLPFDIPGILDAGDTTSNKLDNRLPEYVFPNWRVYKSKNKCVTYGLVYAKTGYNYKGESTEELGSIYSSIKESGKKSKFAFRVATDHHFKPLRLRILDIDPYVGYCGSLGFSPTVRLKEEKYINGDFSNLKTTSKYITAGADIYTGVNLMFERFSIGVELMAFGADFQFGAGKEKNVVEQSIGNFNNNQTYYTSSSWQSNQNFSKLKMSDNQISMYKGLRFVFAFYLDNFDS